jgi:hypothetical protein
MPDIRLNIGGFVDRTLNRLDSLFGRDRELDQLSTQLTSLKEKAYADNKLEPKELEAIYTRMGEVEKKFTQYAEKRGYPVGNSKPASPEAFKVYKEQQQIHFEWLSGGDLRGGALQDLTRAVKSNDTAAVNKLAGRIAFDIVGSKNPAIAKDKVGLLRASLATIPDRKQQEAVLAQVRTRLDQELTKQWPMTAGNAQPPLSVAEFDKASKFQSAVSVQKVRLPAEVAGNNKLFPNRPIPGWEATTRAATKAALDDVQKSGNLFIDKMPNNGGTATVALKLDMNLGMDGPPSVTDPTSTAATIHELLERSAAQGKSVRFTVGDSSGGENVAMGRTSMDIMRDTGNYHYTLKAGLEWAAAKNEPGAKDALAKVNAAESKGVFFGSKDDKVSTPADLKSVEDAASKYVLCVDYDKAGFTRVDPQLGPIGLAAWGAKDFNMAKPWVEADYRVHVARGLSTHILAGWTGSAKGLIGLHAFGTRPADQGADKMGQSMVDTLPLLTQLGGFGAMFQHRSGLSDAVARVAASGDPALLGAMNKAKGKVEALASRGAAYVTYSKEVKALAAELKRDEAAGMPQGEVLDKMRWRTRELLDKADKASPGFRQATWDASNEATHFGMIALSHFRALIPGELKDEKMGMRIGLLTQLPYPSDLVIKSQPKMGEGGGPDAYAKVTDVGVVIAGTDEASTDAAAWKAAGKTENLWTTNHPLHAALIFGRGPMHLDEIKEL